MKKLFLSSQFKKDYKRFRHQSKKKAALQKVLNLLINDQPLPVKYLPHMLQGKYQGCMECHIEGDFLLIWIDAERDIIELVRLGSHSELFG
ncbi:MAG: type II toxin-antitoxin system YafQ family toxin [Paludibacteraceae bacterium]|nr:type II toxin-antitoxin system YafQ family toxin [Paludibacteraceae bacterium]